MRRGESTNDEETETETVDDEVTQSEESGISKRTRVLGIPLYKLSYKRLPRKCLRFSFLSLNTAVFVSNNLEQLLFHEPEAPTCCDSLEKI